jgi:hypothetical protein
MGLINHIDNNGYVQLIDPNDPNKHDPDSYVIRSDTSVNLEDMR